jgi:hypothetical protein
MYRRTMYRSRTFHGWARRDGEWVVVATGSTAGVVYDELRAKGIAGAVVLSSDKRPEEVSNTQEHRP